MRFHDVTARMAGRFRLGLASLAFLAMAPAAAPAVSTIPSPAKTPSPSLEAPGPELFQAKTLERHYDIVLVTGDLLRSLLGTEISRLRLYAHNGGALRPIVYQIDERSSEGEYVFTGGGVAGQDADKGKLDGNDELVFLSEHTGDRVDRTLWPAGSQGGEEIQVADPRTPEKKGWVYLLRFPEAPPARCTEDYVDYDPEADRVIGTFYSVGYPKGHTLYTDFSYPESYGGNNKDMLDRLKIRLDVQAMGGMIHVRRTEQDMHCRVIGWKDGPIRVLRNTESNFRVLFSIPTPSLFSVTEYYPYYFTVPMRFSIPFNLSWVMNKFVVSGFSVLSYADFHKTMIGGRSYTNRNPKGFVLTGHTPQSRAEQVYELSNITWGYFQKQGVGTWFTRMAFPAPLLQYFHLYFRDDTAQPAPPEDEPGEIAGGAFVYSQSLAKSLGVPGGKGFSADFWNVIHKGSVELALDTYIAPPDMKPEEVDEWLAIRDYPLSVSVAGEENREGVVIGEANPDLVRAVILDRRGRRIQLRDLKFHIGSARTTGWDHVLGYETDQEKWYMVPMQRIKTIDFRSEETDPRTGMRSELFISITRKDGKVIDLLSGKTSSFAGHIDETERILLWNSQIQRIELRE